MCSSRSTVKSFITSINTQKSSGTTLSSTSSLQTRTDSVQASHQQKQAEILQLEIGYHVDCMITLRLASEVGNQNLYKNIEEWRERTKKWQEQIPQNLEGKTREVSGLQGLIDVNLGKAVNCFEENDPEGGIALLDFFDLVWETTISIREKERQEGSDQR
jgi:hypothetical protein